MNKGIYGILRFGCEIGGDGFIETCLLRVTIDGYSGCCKSLLGKMLSRKFGLVYIGSGLIYRFATLQLITDKVSPHEISEADLQFLDKMILKPDGTISCCGIEYGEEVLQSDMLQDQVSIYAQNLILRQRITRWIKEFAEKQSVVMDGRDAGTQILPGAEIKVFITSSIEHRVSNWKRMQEEKDGYVDPKRLDKYAERLARRDYDDIHRTISPLRCPPDARCFRADVDGFHRIFAAVSDEIQQYKSGQR